MESLIVGFIFVVYAYFSLTSYRRLMKQLQQSRHLLDLTLVQKARARAALLTLLDHSDANTRYTPEDLERVLKALDDPLNP